MHHVLMDDFAVCTWMHFVYEEIYVIVSSYVIADIRKSIFLFINNAQKITLWDDDDGDADVDHENHHPMMMKVKLR